MNAFAANINIFGKPLRLINTPGMQAQVISKFSLFYYVRGICGVVFYPVFTWWSVASGLFGHPQNRWGVIGLGLFLILVTIIFFYFFSRSWKKITVGPSGIIVDYLVFRRQITIPYAAITHTGTYRRPGTNREGYSYAQDFVIEYGNQSIAFNANYYDNYDELKAEIYNYTLGFDRHRSQY